MWRLQIHYRWEALRQLDKHKWRHRCDNAPLSVHIIFSRSLSQGNTFFCQTVLCFALSMSCWDRNLFEYKYFVGECCFACFAVRARKEVEDHRCLPAFLLIAVTDGIEVFCAQYVCFKRAPSCSLSKRTGRTSHFIWSLVSWPCYGNGMTFCLDRRLVN